VQTPTVFIKICSETKVYRRAATQLQSGILSSNYDDSTADNSRQTVEIKELTPVPSHESCSLKNSRFNAVLIQVEKLYQYTTVYNAIHLYLLRGCLVADPGNLINLVDKPIY